MKLFATIDFLSNHVCSFGITATEDSIVLCLKTATRLTTGVSFQSRSFACGCQRGKREKAAGKYASTKLIIGVNMKHKNGIR